MQHTMLENAAPANTQSTQILYSILLQAHAGQQCCMCARDQHVCTHLTYSGLSRTMVGMYEAAA